MPPAADPVRDQTVGAELDRRQQIIQAAARAFARKGYHATTVKDIAAEADLSPGTLYLYFPGKRDILTAFLEHGMGLAREYVETIDDLDPHEALVAVIEERLGFLRDHRDLVKVLISEALFDPELASRLEDQIAGQLDSFIADLMERWAPGITDQRRLRLAARTFQAQIIFWGVLWPTIAPNQTAALLVTPEELATILLSGIEGLGGQVQADE
ncbi:MAG: TetR/AcrR family transcriptional regulator [Armatimonadetes bacterium]|jgi:AcrR family transcriptional regulator|nr:TetR/AcrR family transcriptional regulator [Armatimonadota bacterium]MDI9582866.1 TetR/AcrR family transcriptional regulator [Acidobacteriota bacterium]